MHDFASLLQPDRGQPATALHLVDRTSLDQWLRSQSEPVRRLAEVQGFRGEPKQVALLPANNTDWIAAIGVADRTALDSWALAKAAEALPTGSYRLTEGIPGAGALGWLLAQHAFTRYRPAKPDKGPRVLLTSEPARIEELVAVARATALVRDLVNTPTEDMGPVQLQQEIERVGTAGGAQVTTTSGDALLKDYPMIHAVGRAAAADRGPRLVELLWGDPSHPRLALVGKGVCFDTGGLDIKPASGMRLMKKDMGGAAHALALAQLVMEQRLPVRLHLLVPAVENAISGAALRPGDVVKSRNGLTVEIHNTDAEGRLILADALTRALEQEPELLIDFATLTGAARVALGPDLPATFANDEAVVAALLAAGEAVSDPLWRLPLWSPYEELLTSDVADIANAGDSPFAGAVTAALFLQKFVPARVPWVHFDTFAWRPAAQPGRPKGGDALGLRAAWRMLTERYGRSTA